jgi:hypothetical protein
MFSFLSGNGADSTGRSRMAFARYKGEAENAFLAAGFPRIFIFRPAYIYPAEPRTEPHFSYRLLRAIYPAFRVLFLTRLFAPTTWPGPWWMWWSGEPGRGEAGFSRTATFEPWSNRFIPRG